MLSEIGQFATQVRRRNPNAHTWKNLTGPQWSRTTRVRLARAGGAAPADGGQAGRH